MGVLVCKALVDPNIKPIMRVKSSKALVITLYKKTVEKKLINVLQGGSLGLSSTASGGGMSFSQGGGSPEKL